MSLGMWDANSGAVAWLQSMLQAAGFDPGPIDGVYGPRTASAVAAFQSSRGLPATGIDDDVTEAALMGGGGAASSSNPQDLIRSKYGNIAWAYSVPELTPIFDQATRENWDEARIIGAISSTNWWKTTAENARQWQELTGTDPAEANRQRQLMSTEIRNMASRLGVTLDGARVNQLTEDALKLGATQQEISTWLVNESRSGFGQLTATADQLRAQAANYALPVSESTLATWAQQIATGAVTADGFVSYLREQAKSQFPTLAAAIDAGITVRQYAEPYIQTAANVLGVNPNGISLSNPKWARPLLNVDQTGTPTAMSLYDWTRMLREDSQYGYDKTPGAISEALEVKNALLGTMGFA